MLSPDTIEQLTQKYQTDKRTVVREYVQHLFLSYFYQQDGSEGIFFKGGTALRIVYQSPRFSEDLDFSAMPDILKSVVYIESIIISTITALTKEGIASEISEAKQTSGGYLAIIDCSVYDISFSLRLEISLRKGEKAGSVVMISGEYVPDYTLMQLDEEQLVSEKISALLSRKKSRDFYDFYFLLRKNLLPLERGNMMRRVLEELQATDINFDKELKEFLPKSHHMIIRDFKGTLEREIKRFV